MDIKHATLPSYIIYCHSNCYAQHVQQRRSYYIAISHCYLYINFSFVAVPVVLLFRCCFVVVVIVIVFFYQSFSHNIFTKLNIWFVEFNKPMAHNFIESSWSGLGFAAQNEKSLLFICQFCVLTLNINRFYAQKKKMRPKLVRGVICICHLSFALHFPLCVTVQFILS